jgi:hypothetical protein
MALLGYARVSTDGQSLTAQVAELKVAGCIEIFQEKITGARTDRKQLERLLGRLGKDDVLVDPPRSAGTVDPRPVESARCYRRLGRRLQVAARHLG